MNWTKQKWIELIEKSFNCELKELKRTEENLNELNWKNWTTELRTEWLNWTSVERTELEWSVNEHNWIRLNNRQTGMNWIKQRRTKMNRIGNERQGRARTELKAIDWTECDSSTEVNCSVIWMWTELNKTEWQTQELNLTEWTTENWIELNWKSVWNHWVV